MGENSFAVQGEEKNTGVAKQVFFGIIFVAGLGLATFCNMNGYPGMAMGFGLLGLIGLTTFIGSLSDKK